MDDKVINTILQVVKECSDSDGWAKQAKVGSQLVQKGVKLKEYGGAKIVFSQLTEQIESSLDSQKQSILRLRCSANSNTKTISENNTPMDKNGLFGLGYVTNLPKKGGEDDCLTILKRMTGRGITIQDIDQYINSDEFQLSFYGKDHENVDNEENAYFKSFVLPFKSTRGSKIIGEFSRKELTKNFVGVFWHTTSIEELYKYGKVNPSTTKDLVSISANNDITDTNIFEYIVGEIEYLNGAGYPKFPDGTTVDEKTGRFIRFKTKLNMPSGEVIYGWFTKSAKGKDSYEGINWGTKEDFKKSLSDRQNFFVGRMVFASQESCNEFVDKLAADSMEEPWEYKNRKDKNFNNPILKSYLEYELSRLFYESEQLKLDNKIIFNKDRTRVFFNTNLLNRLGQELYIVGEVKNIGGKIYVSELQTNPSKLSLKQSGFVCTTPAPPEFFKDINEIVFHCDWEIDSDVQKYKHIIEERRERFPEEYKDSSEDLLATKLDGAINFAKKIAQRNYKFIVPMYYPSRDRIQLLMPIYLGQSSDCQPDFALVLTPQPDEQLYTPETILGLEEVYQDARLIAKPDESWLNPKIIK